jgi:ABC-2 type transport system permease protein
MLAKFLSVYLCVAVASIISVLVGVTTDYLTTGILSATIVESTVQSLATSLSMLAVACSAGVLIGVASPSVMVGAILVIYGGNQISVIPLVPTLLNLPGAALFTVGLAAVVALVLITAAIGLFERKQF